MRNLLFIIIMMINSVIIAQPAQSDTLSLVDCKSTYPITGGVEDLQFVPNVHKWHYCYNLRNQRYPLSRSSDTIYYYHANQIYGDSYKISYLENNGKIRLEYILLKKNKKFKMNFNGQGWLNGLTLQYKTSFEEVLRFFNKNTSDVDIVGCQGPLMSGTKFRNLWHFTVTYFTGEPYNTQISLTFNKHMRLLVIEMDYYDSEVLKVGSVVKNSVF